jgi:DNA-binding MarR family transcriptional regulator
MDRELAIVRLSAAGFVVLLAIDRDAPPTQEALARGLSLGDGTVSDQLRRLERNGLVLRNPARRGGSHSGRGAAPPVAALTDRGVKVLAEAEEIAANVEREWARRLATAGDDPGSIGRALGLRRWLTESRMVLAGGEPSAGR